MAATWLALGLDVERSVLYLQSDVPEVCELAWLLGCVLAKGYLNRAHAYKSALDDNLAAGRSGDEGISAGLFNYPLLMAADILIHDADLVPVGQDNKQHVEITRDVAAAFNAAYGHGFRIPEAVIDDAVATIPGVDGRKMSKSYDNVIPIFGVKDEVRRAVMSIVTDSRRPEEPKDPESCNAFGIARQLLSEGAVSELATRYLEGGVGYREVKELIIEAHEQRFGSARERYEDLVGDPSIVREILAEGADRAREHALHRLRAARKAVGIISAADVVEIRPDS